MKVKVNGAWVDVPAYKVKVGDVACLEGDITLTSGQNNIEVTHNLGKVAIFATIIYTDPYEIETYKPYCASVHDDDFGGFGTSEYYGTATTKNGTATPANSGVFSPHNTDSYVRFYSGSASRLFLVGTYHYKIYYAI